MQTCDVIVNTLWNMKNNLNIVDKFSYYIFIDCSSLNSIVITNSNSSVCLENFFNYKIKTNDNADKLGKVYNVVSRSTLDTRIIIYKERYVTHQL